MNMRKRVFSFLIILSITVVSVSGKAISSNRQTVDFMSSRILNGTTAKLGQFPQQVAICKVSENSIIHFCGGSIIDSKWVLTAAHCLTDPEIHFKPINIKDLLIISGVVTLSYQFPDIKVKRYIVHPDYSMESVHIDIALIEMETPFNFSEFLAPAKLAENHIKAGSVCQVSGWGKQGSDEYSEPSASLKYIDIPVITESTCREWLTKPRVSLQEGQLCAGYEEGQRDSCMFDSGGGLMCNGYLTGIVSAGVDGKCGQPRTPGLYTDVYYYRSWIYSYVRPNTASEQSKRHFLSVFFISIFIYFTN